jgi:hypothetical protein
MKRYVEGVGFLAIAVAIIVGLLFGYAVVERYRETTRSHLKLDAYVFETVQRVMDAAELEVEVEVEAVPEERDAFDKELP